MEKKYQVRRKDKEISDMVEIHQIIEQHSFLTLALSKENLPYIVTLNYGFDKEKNCFYIHCAKKGKKLDYLHSNPIVWGQIIEDLGLSEKNWCKAGYYYKSVQIKGHFTILTEFQEKKQALISLFKNYPIKPILPKDPNTLKSNIDSVIVGKIDILEISGKKSLPN